MRPLSSQYIDAEAAYRRELLTRSMDAARARGRGATWHAVASLLHRAGHRQRREIRRAPAH